MREIIIWCDMCGDKIVSEKIRAVDFGGESNMELNIKFPTVNTGKVEIDVCEMCARRVHAAIAERNKQKRLYEERRKQIK